MKKIIFIVISALLSVYLGFLFKTPSSELLKVAITAESQWVANLYLESQKGDFFTVAGANYGYYFNYTVAIITFIILFIFSRTIYYNMVYKSIGNIFVSDEDMLKKTQATVYTNKLKSYILDLNSKKIPNTFKNIKESKPLNDVLGSPLLAIVITTAIIFWTFVIIQIKMGWTELIILVFCGTIPAFISYNIAIARNRTGWKAATVGFFFSMLGLIGLILFLESKGEKTKKNIRTEKIIIFSVICLSIGVPLFTSAIANYNKVGLAQVGKKLRYIDKLNTGAFAEQGFVASGYYDTFIITLSVEASAKKLGVTYLTAKSNCTDKEILNYSNNLLNIWKQNSPEVINSLKGMGYKYLQGKMLYKDGTIEASKKIEL